MSEIQKILNNFAGLSACSIKNNNNFNQVNLEETFILPRQKPDIEQITKVWTEAIISSYDIVKTPIGTSLEGQNLTGYKLLVCADLSVKMEYVACESTQTLHTTTFKAPFCTYAVLPNDININTRLYPTILVEDIFVEQFDERSIYTNTTMMLLVDIY